MIILKKSRKNGSVIRSRFRRKVHFHWTFLSTSQIIILKKSRKNGSVIRSRFRRKVHFNWTFLLTSQIIILEKVAKKMVLHLGFYTKIIKQHFKFKTPFQKNKHYNCYIYNQIGVSKVYFLRFENKS